MNFNEKYLQWKKNPFLTQDQLDYLEEIKGQEELIEELFYRDLSFGTGGMRGMIGVGTNRINKFQVARATQGYADVLAEENLNQPVTIAISYDTRNQSKEFADAAARVLLANGIGVRLFTQPRPVPEISFAIRELSLDGGIMITASHNPKEYNGYKLYSSYGGQIVPDGMDKISAKFDGITDFHQIKIYEGDLEQHELFGFMELSMDEKFTDQVLCLKISEDIDYSLKIVYSPLHGTGYSCVPDILSKKGFQNLYLVKEQSLPDPNFSTVKIPNPEDHSALNMAIELGKRKGADILMATDPDCDRVGIGVWNESAKEYITLNGNQMGALLIDYILTNGKIKPEAGRSGKLVVVQTVVTGGFGKAIARSFGVEVEEVLTGFKYIGELMSKYETEKTNTYVFGYEESYGCLSGTHARDKDAANACMLLAEMAAFEKKRGETVLNRLEELYQKHGYYFDDILNIAFEGVGGMEKMQAIMEKVRCERVEMLIGENVEMIDFLKDDTGLPRENAMKFILPDGSFAALRPSGTEPKLKIYFSTCGRNMEQAKEKCEKMKTEFKKLIL